MGWALGGVLGLRRFCGHTLVNKGFSLPQPVLLAADSMPEDLACSSIAGASTIILSSERLVEAVGRLERDGVVFQPVESR